MEEMKMYGACIGIGAEAYPALVALVQSDTELRTLGMKETLVGEDAEVIARPVKLSAAQTPTQLSLVESQRFA